MAETDDSASGSNPPNHNRFVDPDPALDLCFSVEEFCNTYSCDFEGDQLEQTPNLDRDWGYIYEDYDSSPWKNDSHDGDGSRYSSNDCWSPVSEPLTGTKKPYIDLVNQEEETRKAKVKRKECSYGQKLGDKKRENSFEHNSSCDFHSLSSESDGDEIESSESGADEMLTEPSAYVTEEKQEVNFQVPETGMVFLSEEEAYKFYKNYAGGIGFSVRKGKVQRLSNGTIRKRYFFCSRQGFRLKKQHDRKTKYKRKETRTGCEAQIQFIVEKGKWVIYHVILEHNHDLESPSQGGKTDSCTKISEADSIMHTVNEAGAVSEAGNANSVRFHDMDCSNYLRDKKINSLQPEDGQSLINYLKHLQVEDPSFFYSVQLDAENRVTNFFWRDGRSKIDYDYFGDILILDTAFRMSIYDMICAPFWGVNHHRQYVLFGCAFLLDESVDSLSWLLGTFMEAMGRRRPKTIVTDESEAMANAIGAVVPESQHCLCMWYICQNARKHLSAYFGQADFESLFNKCIFDCQSEEEFESLWDSLLEQHNLRENPWLNTIYMLRDKWSHLFCKKIFSAGIQSTHGSENINNVFQNLASEIMTLPKFVQQYERAAEQSRREELYEDFRCNGSASATILRTNAMEKQAAKIYTRTMFKIFQGELLGCLSVAIEEIANDGSTIARFKLIEEGHKKENLVEFNCSDSKVTCSCEKFESFGILCVHALKVLNARNIFHIPPQYVLKRWTKYAKEGLVEDDHGAQMADKSQRPLSLYTSKLMHKALNVITKSVALEESRKIAEDDLDMTLKRVEDILKTKNIGHFNRKYVEVDCEDDAGNTNGIGRMETQKVMSNSPYIDLEEESRQRMRSQIEKRCKNEVRETESNSCDDAIGHHQPPQELTKGVDEGSSGGFSTPVPSSHGFPWPPSENGSSEANSAASSFQMDFCINRGGNGGGNKRDSLEGVGNEVEAERASSRASDEGENVIARKKLRLSKEQSAFLEESFREHSALNPKQKLALAKQVNLRPRQVEVWFQNRRGRTKLKQTEVDREYFKRCCETLTKENRRLLKDLQELRALKTSNPFYMQLPATTSTSTATNSTGFPPPRTRFYPFSQT